MKKVLIFTIFSLFFTSVEAQESILTETQMECPLAIPVFEEEACADPNFFRTGVAPKIEEINQMLQENLDELFHDNQAHPEFMATESVKNFRTYHYCFNNLCEQVYTNCSASNMSHRPVNEYEWCKKQQTKLETLQKQKIHYIAVGNIERKSRSLLEEKINALGYRFNQFIHPRKREINAVLDKMKSRIEFLIKRPSS